MAYFYYPLAEANGNEYNQPAIFKLQADLFSDNINHCRPIYAADEKILALLSDNINHYRHIYAADGTALILALAKRLSRQ